MSSLPWNSPGATTCHCDRCAALADPECSLCGADGIPLEWDDLSREYLCATCAPREGETCGDYIDRCREIRGRG